MMAKREKLTARQKKFADWYIELGNAEQAAVKAGYSKKYARGNAHKLVAKGCIKAYIEERLAEKEKERIASQDEVLEFLTEVLRGNVTEKVPVVLLKDFKIVDKEPSVKDRLKAAELLGKRYALFKEKVEHEGKIETVQYVAEWGGDGGNSED